jgi:YjbR
VGRPPLGDTVAKVRKKIFVFVGTDSITVKLDESHLHALSVADAAPRGYGLGASGWVTVPVAGVPLQVLRDRVEESYRIVAPKVRAQDVTCLRRRWAGLVVDRPSAPDDPRAPNAANHFAGPANPLAKRLGGLANPLATGS